MVSGIAATLLENDLRCWLEEATLTENKFVLALADADAADPLPAS